MVNGRKHADVLVEYLGDLALADSGFHVSLRPTVSWHQRIFADLDRSHARQITHLCIPRLKGGTLCGTVPAIGRHHECQCVRGSASDCREAACLCGSSTP